MLAITSAGIITGFQNSDLRIMRYNSRPELAYYSDIYSLIAPRYLLFQNGLKEPPTDFTVPIATEAMKEISLIYADYGKPDNATLLAHPEGHVVDVKSLMEFFSKTLR
jgi:hypothetical protein